MNQKERDTLKISQEARAAAIRCHIDPDIEFGRGRGMTFVNGQSDPDADYFRQLRSGQLKAA